MRRRVIHGATSLYEGVTWLCAKSGVSVKVPATPTTGTENSLAATATIKCPVLHSAPPSACDDTQNTQQRCCDGARPSDSESGER